MDWAEIGGHIFATIVGALVIGISGFFLWIWKKSVYGRLDTLELAINQFGTEFTEQLNEAKRLAERNVVEAKLLAERGLSDIKEDVNEAKIIATRGISEVKEALQKDYVPYRLCDSERNGCQKTLLSKMESMSIKMDLVIKRQDAVISRMDHHMNGHSGTRSDD